MTSTDREYLGQHKCERCHAKLVRVYDWLPSPVICSTCRAAVKREEKHAEERAPRDVVLGWARGQTKRGDETGLVHLLIAEPAYGLFTRARPVCGSRGALSGQVEREVPAGTNACRRCAAWKER